MKTERLENRKYKRLSFFFLKILLKALVMGLKPIYIDKCGFNLLNDNFHNWIKKNSAYHSKVSIQNSRINLS